MAQKAERNYLRRGNRFYKDSTYVDAEINYRKALDANPNSTMAMYNLGNALLYQNKPQEALEQYATVANIEKDKENLAKDLHNVGVIWHTQKDYQKAIAAYKEALRKNPHDDETRYNLALAMKMLKDGQQQNQNQEQNQQEQQQQQQNEQQQQQQNQEQNNDNQMSKENAEQLLRSVMQDEKDVQDRVKKQVNIKGNRLEKDW
jgi:tetratricopeptide (TPR) repeat protein